MRFTAFLLMGLLGLWFFTGAPVPMQVEKPLEANDELPTFNESVAGSINQRRLLEEAIEMGRVSENPERRKLRQAFFDAQERLSLDPCDDELQQDFALAAAPFFEAATGKRQLPVETVTIDGKPMNASAVMEDEIQMTINLKLFSGQIRSENMPPSMKQFARVLDRARPKKAVRAVCTG